MRIEIDSCSYQGGRDYNEDCVRYLAQDGFCAVTVADGLGGHGGGQIASAVVAEYITEGFAKNPTMETENIRSLFDGANAEVLAAQTSAQKMKSTGAALFIKDGAAIWGHAGDSRLYHFKDGRLITQTLDHSASQLAVYSGEITVDQIRCHDDRNRVLKAFGGDEHIKAEITGVNKLEAGFHAFLLCTDGFWEYVLEPEMEMDLARCNLPGEWLQAMVARLSRRAPKGNDNFTAAAVFLAMM
jgi:serine/threonine protein phosphatase PrpC